MDEGIALDVRWWLLESTCWDCTCRGAEMFLCDRCLISTSLDAAAVAVDLGDWATAHRAVLRAAGIDGRLVPLRDALELLVHPYQSLEVVDMGDTEPKFRCGLTRSEHVEACGDAIIRGAEYVLGEQHDEEVGTHLQYATHRECGATFCLGTLPGHVADEVAA